MWVAMNLVKEVGVNVPGRTVKLPISDLAEGCVGFLLVFDTKEAAEEYAEVEDGNILQVEYCKKPA